MSVLIERMIMLFVIMIVGYIAAKKDIMDKTTSKKISSIVVNIANPAVIVGSGLSVSMEPGVMVEKFAIALAFYVFVLVISFLMPIVLRADKSNYGAYRIMTTFSNVGFMGIPLVSAMYGPEAVIFATTFNIIYGILIYTYGIMQLGAKVTSIKSIFNIGIVTSIMALIFAFMDIQLPEVVTGSLTYLGNMTAPLSMMVIGASFVGLTAKDLFCDVEVDIFVFLKQLIIPAITVLVCRALGMSGVDLGVILIMIGTPIGSMTAMLAQQYDSNVALITKGVALTTLLSVGTISLVSLLLV